jgi:hypothetical protein
MTKLHRALALGSLFALALPVSQAAADEGMWLPTQLAARAEQMKSLGLELPVEQLADLAQSSGPAPAPTCSSPPRPSM